MIILKKNVIIIQLISYLIRAKKIKHKSTFPGENKENTFSLNHFLMQSNYFSFIEFNMWNNNIFCIPEFLKSVRQLLHQDV